MKNMNESKVTICQMAVILSMTGAAASGGAIVRDNSLEQVVSEMAQNPVPDSNIWEPSKSKRERLARAERVAAIDRMIANGGNYHYGIRSHIRAMRG